jgi:ABC-type multidrug transport system permease subunit
MNYGQRFAVDPVGAQFVIIPVNRRRRFLLYMATEVSMKHFLLLALALVGVIIVLYAGLNGLTKNHSYGFFFVFIGSLTTIGLGIDVVSHLKTHIRKNNVRKLGRL